MGADSDRWERSWTREEFTRWLLASCQRQGVPVVMRDAATVRTVLTLLGGPATPAAGRSGQRRGCGRARTHELIDGDENENGDGGG
jgi:hypothetical protein